LQKFKIVNKILWNDQIKRKIRKFFPYNKLFNDSTRSKIFLQLNKLNTNKSKSNEKPDELVYQLNAFYKVEVDQLSYLLNMEIK